MIQKIKKVYIRFILWIGREDRRHMCSLIDVVCRTGGREIPYRCRSCAYKYKHRGRTYCGNDDADRYAEKVNIRFGCTQGVKISTIFKH